MLVMLQIVALLLAFAFSLVTLNYLERARKRQWLLALVQKPSTGLLLRLHKRFFCCDGYLKILESGPTLLFCDKKSAFKIAHNDVFHEQTKHIEIA